MLDMLNVWELRWVLYLLGFIFVPRINLLFIWHFHGGTFWDRRAILFVPGWFLMPRMMTGLIVAFTTENFQLGAIMAIAGFLMDGGMKYFCYKRRKKKD
jgi:hypothetical protein